MTRRSLQRRNVCTFGAFTVTLISLWYIYNGLIVEELEVCKEANGLFVQSPYVEVLKTIPPYGDGTENAVSENDDVPYIDSAAEDEQEWKKRLPNALIIGVRKAGTRALLDSLALHPSVRACPREVHYFDRQENYDQGFDWYREQMPTSLPGQITIEKSPAYYVTDEVPARVHEMSSTVKLLVVVRDPTIRAISDYAQLYEKLNGKMRPFEELVTVGPNQEVLRNESKLVTVGVYERHLKKWLKYFPRNQIHFVNGEELVKKPVQELKIVQKFLGIKPFIDERFYYFNESKGFPCLISPGQKGNFQGGKVAGGCLSDSKGRPHPPVKESVIQLLRDYYRPLNQAFYRAVDQNFGWP